MTRILVVDDDPLVGRSLTRLLRDAAVTVVAALQEAVKACDAADFDAILCDRGLPGRPGDELAGLLSGPVAGRIVLMSGDDEPPRSGVRWLAKPFGAVELRAAIEAASGLR